MFHPRWNNSLTKRIVVSSCNNNSRYQLLVNHICHGHFSFQFIYCHGNYALSTSLCVWNFALTTSRTSPAPWSVRRKRSSLSSSVSWGSSNHDSMGIPLSTWYPNAWGLLSTKTALLKSRPMTVRSLRKLPSTGRQESRNILWRIYFPSVIAIFV